MGRIRHIEIAGQDGAALGAFYRSLFDWDIGHRDVAGYDYYDIVTDSGFTAGIRHEPEGRSEIVVYVEVDDVDAAFRSALDLGADARIPPMTHGNLRLALIVDPAGNPVGLTQPTGPRV